MDELRRGYWSVDECRWETLPSRELVEGAVAELPTQRTEEPAEEPVDA
jgi:hypothetical protein